jgi:hypothetical protein
MVVGRGAVRAGLLCVALLALGSASLVIPNTDFVTLAGQVAQAKVPNASIPAGLRLTASPSLVDVGDAVSFTLQAQSWPAPAGAVLSLVSPHHGFTGGMVWDGHCPCFRLGVILAKRAHPIEKGIATATVRSGGSVGVVRTTFFIRGLARNGSDYSPGGTPALKGWVSDPAPSKNQVESFCGWVKAADGVGFPGYQVSFVVHYSNKTQSWHAGPTNNVGIRCSHKSIGNARSGVRVSVDVYANSLRTRTSFTPR